MENKADQVEASHEDLLDSESKHFQQFQKFFVPIYSPRTSYSLQREQELHMFQQLTAHFDPFTINFLKSEFEQRKGTLSLHEFILVLRRHLLQWQKGLEARETRLTQLLASIFHQVNTSEMQRITWEQFSFYLIGKATALSRKVQTKPEQTVKQYSLALDIHLTARANDVFTSIVALPNLNRVAIITDKSDELRFFNLLNGSEDVKPIYLDEELAHLRNIQRRKHFKKFEVQSPQIMGKRNMSGKISGSYPKKQVASAKRRDIERLKSLMTEEAVMELEKMSNVKKTTITAIAYLDGQDLLAVATEEGLISLWRWNRKSFKSVYSDQDDPSSKNQDGLCLLEAGGPQFCLAWDNSQKLLYSGGEGIILQWSLHRTQPLVKFILPSAGANAVSGGIEGSLCFGSGGGAQAKRIGQVEVVALQVLHKLRYVASGSHDSSVILWDTITGQLKRSYKEHTKGVLALAFSATHTLLFSAGFDHEICAWNPYIDTLVYKLRQHNAPLISVTCPPQALSSSPQLISADIEGIIKIWDIRTFRCVQTLHIESILDVSRFQLSQVLCLHIRAAPFLLVLGKQLAGFHYDKNYNPSLVDENIPVCIAYNKPFNQFLTPAGNLIKTWDLFTGRLKLVFEEVVPSIATPVISASAVGKDNFPEITAFALDHAGRRYAVGDSSGRIIIMSHLNGAPMKSLTSHNSEVSIIIFFPEMAQIISASHDNFVMVHDDSQLRDSRLLKKMDLRLRPTLMASASFIKRVMSRDVPPVHIQKDFGGQPAVPTSGLSKDRERSKEGVSQDVTRDDNKEAPSSHQNIGGMSAATSKGFSTRRTSFYEGTFKSNLAKQRAQESTPNTTNYMTQEFQIRAADILTEQCILIIGLFDGSLRSIDLETGWTDATWRGHYAEITTVCCLQKMAVFIACDSLGESILWAAPPLGNKYKPVIKFSGLLNHVAVQCVAYNYADDVLYTGDEKGCITAFCIADPAKELRQESAKKSKRFQVRSLTFPENKITPLWNILAHNEAIKSIIFIDDVDKLIVTSAFDRKVLLWNPENGEFYDSLKQGTKFKPKPIDFRPREAATSVTEKAQQLFGTNNEGSGKLEEGGGSLFAGFHRSSTQKLNQAVTTFISNKHNMQHIFHKLHLKRAKKGSQITPEQEDLQDFLRLLMTQKLDVFEKIKQSIRNNQHSTLWRFFPNVAERIATRQKSNAALETALCRTASLEDSYKNRLLMNKVFKVFKNMIKSKLSRLPRTETTEESEHIPRRFLSPEQIRMKARREVLIPRFQDSRVQNLAQLQRDFSSFRKMTASKSQPNLHSPQASLASVLLKADSKGSLIGTKEVLEAKHKLILLLDNL